MKFSIITPIWLSKEDERRVPLFQACIESINAQTYDHNDFEHIIINDGSPVAFDVPAYKHIKVINQPNLQRLTAYNTGFKAAQGEIFCLLDSDDAYTPDYLEKVTTYYKKFPWYNLFNMGSRHNYKNGKYTYRQAFSPKEEKIGHEIFGGGKIVNGTFVFSRKVYEDLGAYPEHHIKGIDCTSINYGKVRDLWMTSPFDFSGYAQVEFPEIREFFMVNHVDEPNKIIKELGNPWGNDYYLFYKYTRKYHSKPMGDCLYIVNQK